MEGISTSLDLLSLCINLLVNETIDIIIHTVYNYSSLLHLKLNTLEYATHLYIQWTGFDMDKLFYVVHLENKTFNEIA